MTDSAFPPWEPPLAGTEVEHPFFELFGRRLPAGRRYGVVAGVGRAVEAIEAFTFDEPTIDWLLANDVVDQPLADWLRALRPRHLSRSAKKGRSGLPSPPQASRRLWRTELSGSLFAHAR